MTTSHTDCAEPAWLTQQFLTEPRRAVRFYLAVGRFEPGDSFPESCGSRLQP